jgi:hypothetical protein
MLSWITLLPAVRVTLTTSDVCHAATHVNDAARCPARATTLQVLGLLRLATLSLNRNVLLREDFLDPLRVNLVPLRELVEVLLLVLVVTGDRVLLLVAQWLSTRGATSLTSHDA